MKSGEAGRFTSLDEAIRSIFGTGVRIADTRRIGGGDINEAYGLRLTDGSHIFMKSNAGKGESFFAAEVAGLSAIAQTKTIGTPRILGSGTDKGGAGYAFLLMEFVEGRQRISDYWAVFASQLAAMHLADTSAFTENGAYGFLEDNFIGERAQKNIVSGSWIAFFRDCRLRPQFQSASAYFSPAEWDRIERLLERLEEFLIEPERPSLLHGDLWSGNFITGNDGKAWLIDPAAYVGNAEADLAMTELFGGFPPAFYEAYRKAYPLKPGYEHRRDLYNLYHLLNHLNMFGRAYLSPVRRILGKYVPQ